MRLPSTFAFVSLTLLTGSTFGSHAPRTDFEGVPSYSTVLEHVYEASRDIIGEQLSEALAVEFPETFDATARIEQVNDHTFLVRSWVREQSVTGAIATIPWTTHVRCDDARCTVEQAELDRANTL